MKRLLVILPLAWLLVSCSNSSAPVGDECPTPEAGPGLGIVRDYLLFAGSLSENWGAVDISEDPPALLPETGLTGQAPNDMDIVDNKLYIVNSGDNSVTVVNLSTGCAEGWIEVGTGANPWEFSVDPAGPSRAWLTTFLGGELLELDLDSLKVVRRVVVGPATEGLLVTNDHVAVTLTGWDGATFSYGQGFVVVFEKSSLTEVARLPVPTNPQFLLPDADGRTHVVCTGDFGFPAPGVFGRVVRIEADWSAVRDTLETGGSPGRATLASDGTAYLASFFGGVLAYNTASFQLLNGVADPVLSEVGFTDVETIGSVLYAANFDGDKIVKLSLVGSPDPVDIPVPGDGPSALVVRGGSGP
jgi:YVTN family beta-propeller protein